MCTATVEAEFQLVVDLIRFFTRRFCTSPNTKKILFFNFNFDSVLPKPAHQELPKQLEKPKKKEVTNRLYTNKKY